MVASTEGLSEITRSKERGSRGAAYRRAIHSPRGWIGVGLLLAMIVGVVVALVVVPYGPYEQGPDALQSPNSQHLLGTDELGRDLMARTAFGTAIDLLITLIAVPIAALAGTLLGLLGFLSSVGGSLVQRLFDILLGVPAVILGIAIAIALQPSIKSVIVAVILVTMPRFGRQARASLLENMNRDYVLASHTLGLSRRSILLGDIVPNVVDVVFVRAAVSMAQAITVEGGMSVIGLGIQPPTPSLGVLIKMGSSYLTTEPQYALAPVGVVAVMVSGYMLIADALTRSLLRH